MNSSAPGRGCRRSGYQRLDNQASSANRWSHRVKRLPSVSGRQLTTDEACYAPRSSQRSATSHQSFDSLINPERLRELKDISDRFGKRYDGKAHGKFATKIKDYTTNCQRPLNLYEQTRLMPWLEAFKPQSHWSWHSLSTLFYSLTAAGAFAPRPYTDQAVSDAQAASLTGLLDAVRHQCQQKTDARGIDARGLANLLWAVAKLIDNGRDLTLEMKETVTVLLPHVVVLKDQFIPQNISSLLWAVAKLVDNSQELVTELKELLVVLLPRVHALNDQFNAWGIASLLWAMAKLLDNGQELTPAFKEAVATLLTRVTALKERFIAQGVANLLWALAKLVEKGLALTPELQEVLAALLPRVIVLKEQFIAQHIANLLWAVAKLADHGQELVPQFKEVVVVLLPHLYNQKNQFSTRGIANLLWALAKLVDNGHELTAALKKAVAALLSQVKAVKNQFVAQGIVNLLWALAKLVDSGQELTPEFKETVAALLPHVSELKEKFTAQGIATLLWAVAKLLDNGQELTPEYKGTLATLLPCMSVLKDQFDPRGIASLLWTLGSLGDLVSTAVTVSMAESMLCQSKKFLLFTQQELIMSLWGLLVCCARLYLSNTISDQYDTLECLINKLFSHLENEIIDNEQRKSVMALAASWLGRACPVDPCYQTANSATQSAFQAQLQSALPSLKIEQERSVHSLPPVDLLLPEHRIAIEIQGPSHYVGRDFQIRNGSTLLKTALLRKAGYDVLEIPVNHLQHRDSVETYIDQIRRKMIEMPADDGK